jgi:outer membrane protein assembly factor BamB
VKTKAQVHATAAVANGLAYISGCDGILRAIRVTNGSEAYVVEIGSYTGASPALEGQMAYVGTFNNEVFGLNLQTRRSVWKYEHPERKFPFYSTAAVSGGRIYVGGRDKMLHALDAKTGKAAWTFLTKARVDSSPVIADGRVIFGSNDGNVYFVDAVTGKQTYQFTAGAAVSSSPALSGDKVIVSAQDGKIYCLGS